jgi:FkbM family methyltransferase
VNLYRTLARLIDRFSQRAGCAVVKTHSIYCPAIGPDSMVLDLGANVGDFCQEMNRRFGCTCHAVEANPDMAAQIATNDRLHVHNLAVSDRNGAVTLVLSANRECSSLYSELASLFGTQGTIECPAVTLEQFLHDNQITTIDVLKIDIEGAERQLFQATSDVTLSAVNQITIEFHDFIPGTIDSQDVRRICKRLQGLGFYCLPFSYMLPNQDTCDFLFVSLQRCAVPWKTRVNFFMLKALLNVQKAKAYLKRSRPTHAPLGAVPAESSTHRTE